MWSNSPKYSNLNVNSKIIFYDDSITDLYSDTAYGVIIYPVEKGSASLVIDGVLNINDKASFSSKISSNSADSVINVSPSATLSTDSHEGSGDYTISGTTQSILVLTIIQALQFKKQPM